MTTKLPLTLTVATLLASAAPALADHHVAKPDPQAATTTAKPKAQENAPAKDAKATQAPQTPAAQPKAK